MSQRACTRCIAKKRRCDHERPSCGPCGRVDAKCEYPPPQSRRGPVAGLLKAAEARVQQCENALWYILNISGARDALAAAADGTGLDLPSAPTADLEREERARWWAEHPLDNQESLLDFYDECSRRAAGSSAHNSGESVTITRGSSLTVSTPPPRAQETPPRMMRAGQSSSTAGPDSRHVLAPPGSPQEAGSEPPGDKERKGDSSAQPPNTLEGSSRDDELEDEAGTFLPQPVHRLQPTPSGANRKQASGVDFPPSASRSDIRWSGERTHAGLSGLAAIATDTFRLVGLSPPESPAPTLTIPDRHSPQGAVGEDLRVDLLGREEPPPPPYMTHVTPGNRMWAAVGPGASTADSNVRHGAIGDPPSGELAPGPSDTDDREQVLHKILGSPAPLTHDAMGPVNGDEEILRLSLPPALEQTDPVSGALEAFPIGRAASRDRRALARNPLKRRSAGKAGGKSKRQKDIFW